ncbi:hypothetical protein G3N56_11750 [Desulfovibrio sulfodismutans]|uniref:Uncharacterized protein n=1 Tax=Desulfolutivibrio sulfodismutans TaxID=63561 RepID=A0A7K3NMI9_9BACT|nr:hypothetical protein [Desulfolutivibrio sulfodismutans]NDY57414.1 hypothetical protein [Desulfolutivibrio sulfodismutans]QLA11896.1 hypothetical protein GD606_06285 [Desulfolutivibrio sulfodismutans DSM 3696]QLA13555.1 hypothetical protein GD606_15420 [Desulfolutivibrio sulfodismutans DSM 3696]
MEKWQCALINEQGVSFAVMLVKPRILSSQGERDRVAEALSIRLGVPVVLAAENNRHGLDYWGRKDLVGFLANVPPQRLPWREVTFS